MTAAAPEVNFAGLWIPAKVLLCPDIKGHEVLLFAQIYALQANPRGCYASNDYFSKFLSIAKSTVSEYIKGLQDKGLIDVLRGRDEHGVEERQMYVSAVGAQLFAPSSPMPRAVEPEVTPPSAERSPPFGGPKPPLRPSEGENKDINITPTSAYAREGLVEFWERVKEAAGDALADPARCPGVCTPRELLYLLNDLPNSPACTAEEVIDGVRAAAMWWREKNGPGSMVNFDLARKKAWQYRDARLRGAPVRDTGKSASRTDWGDPRTFSPERWRAIFKAAPKLGGWQTGWGPEPGEQGSFVPTELVELWKGKVDA